MPTRGRHEPGDRLIGLCVVIGMADRTTGITTIECPFITIQRVRYKQSQQVALAEHQRPVQTLRAHGLNPPLRAEDRSGRRAGVA
jgi:hypothetical protein